MTRKPSPVPALRFSRCAATLHRAQRITERSGAWFAIRNFGRSFGLSTMFLFFSNGVGIAGSIIISVLLTLLLVYACSGP